MGVRIKAQKAVNSSVQLMKATVAFFGPPPAVEGRPVLSPELAAAVAARHSRCDEGLDKILGIVDSCESDDVAIGRIFNMIDYGHRSVADLVPISVHLEGISVWLAEIIWSLVHTGGGQESSTRYCKLRSDSMYHPTMSGPEAAEWGEIVSHCLRVYDKACAFWTSVANARPQLVGITEDMSPQKAERFRKNFVFDRSRYAIPSVALTNMNITTWGTEWIRIISQLKSSPWSEAHQAADLLLDEVTLAAPRLVRHTGSTVAAEADWFSQMDVLDQMTNPSTSWMASQHWRAMVKGTDGDRRAMIEALEHEVSGRARIDINLSSKPWMSLKKCMEFRTNRYDPVGKALSKIPVIYGWSAVANAEIRDMNRHRPGIREIGFAPRGFYFAQDKILEVLGWGDESMEWLGNDLIHEFLLLAVSLFDFQLKARQGRYSGASADFVYLSALGTELGFEHTSTLGHLIYECELRTGPGTHFRYRRHYLDLIEKMNEQIPGIKKEMLLGSGEPE